MTTKAQAGFDLTKISADNWEMILDLFDLEDMGWVARYPGEEKYKEYGQFNFQNDNLLIVTGNHPIKGWYATLGRREDDIGYASYIGIEGDPKLVKAAFKAIKRLAEYTKDEDANRRQFI